MNFCLTSSTGDLQEAYRRMLLLTPNIRACVPLRSMLHRGIPYGMEDFPVTGRRNPANPSAGSRWMHEKFNP
jgi:hypothetical protein